MPTIDKVLAEKEIARLKTQKNPKVYCVVRYQDRLRGDSEKMTYSGYSICNKRAHYEALMRSNNVGGVDVLWASERFTADAKKQEDDEDWKEAASYI